jgi:glycerol-3-phosphate O-acyltransferase
LRFSRRRVDSGLARLHEAAEGTKKMALTDARIRAAQARWELQLAILQEEEKRLLNALEEHSRREAALPQEFLDRLKAARSQCNKAFQSLMACVQERGVRGQRQTTG